MRRIAAVFTSKRSERSDAASSSAASTTTEKTQATAKTSSSKRFFRSVSRKNKPVDPHLDTLSSTDFHPPSSSSSSSGAPSTPDDDHGSLLKLSASKVWAPLPPIPVQSPLGSFHHPDHHPDRLPTVLQPDRSPSTEDGSSEESSLAPDHSIPPERSTPLTAPAYLLALTSTKSSPPYAPPPLLHVPNRPAFPRSCNPTHSLPHADTLESNMHRTTLQRRLQRGDLSPAETRSIASFSGRRSALKDRPSLVLDDTAVRVGSVKMFSDGLKKWVERPCFEDRLAVLLADYLPLGGLNPNQEPAWARLEPATECGVADLEYSLTLEVLAGLYEDILPSEHSQHSHRQGQAPDSSAQGYPRLDTHLPLDLGLSLTLTHSPTFLGPSSSLDPSPATTMSTPSTAVSYGASLQPPQPSAIVPSSSSRGQQYKPFPSPLRMEAVSTSPTKPSPSAAPANAPAASSIASAANAPAPILSPPQSPPMAPAPLKPALKQGVRFVEGEKQDKEDHVPLGYVMRIKQKREEKARFLQAERERRQHEEARRKHEEARRKHEEEKRKWEEERAVWDREKRAMEEERRKKLYADEVAAARSRRESQRFGFGPLTGDSLATGQWDRGERPRQEREASGPSYLRPAYDPAAYPMPRTNSDSFLAMPHSSSRRGSTSGSGSGSPEDSRPNSIYGTGSATGSRPPSTHSGVQTPSSSQQDVGLREHRTAGNRRTSMVSETGSSRRRSEVPVPRLPTMWNMGVPMNAPPMPVQGMGMPMGMPMGMSLTPVAPMGMSMYGMGMDMPLLPPSPPFMQQYGRSSSRGQSSSRSRSPSRSHNSSPTPSRRDLSSSNSSSERVNRMSRPGQESSHASARGSSLPRSESASASYTQRPTHHRTGSGGSNRPSVSARSHPDYAADRRSTKSVRQPAASTSPTSPGPRPKPAHSSSLPPSPPVTFSQPRSSWSQPGFENLSRPSGRRQTAIS